MWPLASKWVQFLSPSLCLHEFLGHLTQFHGLNTVSTLTLNTSLSPPLILISKLRLTYLTTYSIPAFGCQVQISIHPVQN